VKHTRIIVTHYGGPDALRVLEEECPEPKDGEVRVRMLAAGVVGSRAGAVTPKDDPCLYPGFPPSCPARVIRGPVSNSLHIARSMRISRTTRPCTLHLKVYETYPAGTTFGRGRTR
jgi:hypothetical protein